MAGGPRERTGPVGGPRRWRTGLHKTVGTQALLSFSRLFVRLCSLLRARVALDQFAVGQRFLDFDLLDLVPADAVAAVGVVA